MPIPKPTSGEAESKFIGRCVSFLHAEGYENDKALAVCYDRWSKKEEIEKMGKITEIFDEVQDGNPVRATANRTAGTDPLGYDKPEGIVAGQYEDTEVREDQDTPRSSDQDLDDLFPIK